MKKSTIIIIVISVIVIICLAVCSFFAISWLLIWGEAYLFPDPPKPEVTYGEFPFEIVLEIDGEAKIFNDIYICEYDGIGSNEGVGKYRTWKGYIKGTGKETIFIKDIDNKKIYCSVGAEDIYMGDCEPYYEGGEIPVNEPIIYSIENYANGGRLSHIFSEADMEKYGIRIISYNFSPPIDNTFK